MGPEARIERTTWMRASSELGVASVKMGELGWPDRVFLFPNERLLFIEFKAPGEEPRPLQLLRHAHLRRMGFKVEVHDNVDTALESIRRHLAAALATTEVSAEGGQVSS